MRLLELEDQKFRQSFLSGSGVKALSSDEVGRAFSASVPKGATVLAVGQWGKGDPMPVFLSFKPNDMGFPGPKFFRGLRGIGSGVPMVKVRVDGRLVTQGRMALQPEQGKTQPFRLPRGVAGKAIQIEVWGEFTLSHMDIEWEPVSMKQGG